MKINYNLGTIVFWLINLNSRRVLLSYDVYPICLPSPGATFDGKTAAVVGWGRLSSGNFSNIVMEANLTILSNIACSHIFRRKYGFQAITEQNLCAKGSPGVDACEGDSGGPLNCLNEFDMRYDLCGIVSWGDETCRSARPGVYTRPNEYLMWIYDTIPLNYPCAEGLECLPPSECMEIEFRKKVANWTTSPVVKEALEQELEGLMCHDLSIDEIFASSMTTFNDAVSEKYCCKKNPAQPSAEESVCEQNPVQTVQPGEDEVVEPVGMCIVSLTQFASITYSVQHINFVILIRGLPFMTSALRGEGGTFKSRHSKQP